MASTNVIKMMNNLNNNMSGADFDNYFKILVAVQKYGTNSYRGLIKYQLERSQMPFCELLNKNAHELYHLYNRLKCCRCGPIYRLPDIMSIREDQYFVLFQKENKPRLNGHVQTPRDLKCCNYANTSVSPDDLDLSLAHTLLMHCCQELLWYCCLAAKHKTLEEFLNSNKHDIIHMAILQNQSCRLCSNGIKPTVKGYLRKDDWNLLFDDTKGNNDPIDFDAKTGINVSDLNPRLSYTLLQAFSYEVELCKQLRKIRNSIVHRPSCSINTAEFTQMWSDIKSILSQISEVYGGVEDIEEKLRTLETGKSNLETLMSLCVDMSRDAGIEATLNTVESIILYMKEHLSTKDDDYRFQQRFDAIEANINERLAQLQKVVESISSNQIKSRELQLQVEVKGTKVYLNKSSVEFLPDNITQCADDSNTYVVQKILNQVLGKSCTQIKETDEIFKITNLKLRLDDQTATAVEFELKKDKEHNKWFSNSLTNCLRWMYQYMKHVMSKYVTMRPNQKENPIKENTIKVKLNVVKDMPETEDVLRCGLCKETFTTIEAFSEHKRLEKERHRNGIRTNVTLERLSDEQVAEILKFSKRNGMKVGNITVLGEAKGSLIIWTRISTAAFKTKYTFLTVIEQLLQHVFSESPTDIDRTTNLTLKLKIEDINEDGYIDDEEDFFRCGTCLEEFYVLEAFKLHKKNPCQKELTDASLCELTITDNKYLVVEYDTNEFSRLHGENSGLEDLKFANRQTGRFIDIIQPSRAIFYKRGGYKDVDIRFFRGKSCKTVMSQEAIDTENRNGAIICFLEADYGHLTNMDRNCLHDIRQKLQDQRINKTMFVVTAASFFECFRNFHTLSYEISKELGLEMNDIFFRIFKEMDIHILKLMSLYFENWLIEKQDVCYNEEVQSRDLAVQETIRHISSVAFTMNLRHILLVGPLGDNLHDILRNAAKSYKWTGTPISRNNFIVKEATDKIARYACAALAKEIVQTLIRDLQNYPQFVNQNVFGVIFEDIDLMDFEKSIMKGIVLVLGPIGWIVSLIRILFSGTDINSYAFRNEVALKLRNQIDKNIDKIISEVVDKFRLNVLPVNLALEVSRHTSKLASFIQKKKDLIRKNIIENEFGTLARQNRLIRDFKFEYNTLKIYARGDWKNYVDIKMFVATYFRRDVNTQIIMDL